MPGPIEHLPTTETLLGRFDPRWKLASLLLAALAVVLLRTSAAAGLALVGALVLALLGRLPLRWTLARLGLVFLVLTPFLVLLPFVHRNGEPLAELGLLRISGPGILAALRLAGKTLSLVLLMLVLLVTAPVPTTFKAAQALHIPGLLVQLAGLTYRYVFVLAGELARLRVALRVRGYRNRPSRHSYRTVGHVAGTLLVRGYEQAERVEQAMRCRGFDGQFHTLTDFRTRWQDVALFLLMVGFSALVLLLDIVASS